MNKQFSLLLLAFAITDATYVSYENPYGNVYTDGSLSPLAAIDIGYPAFYKNGEHSQDYYAYPQYSFNYGVNDPHTGDIKSQEEVREGDVVKGSYSLNEPDGTIRVVEYTADDHNGFNAIVKKIGHSLHPATISGVQYSKVAPVYYARGNYDGYY